MKLTAFLVRGLDVVPVANQSADSFPQAVPVRLLGAFIQQSIRNQARVTLTFKILHGGEAAREMLKFKAFFKNIHLSHQLKGK